MYLCHKDKIQIFSSWKFNSKIGRKYNEGGSCGDQWVLYLITCMKHESVILLKAAKTSNDKLHRVTLICTYIHVIMALKLQLWC